LLDTEEPFWHLRLGECYKKLARFDDARASLLRGINKLFLGTKIRKAKAMGYRIPSEMVMKKRFEVLLKEGPEKL
jgi:hypothetical protein